MVILILTSEHRFLDDLAFANLLEVGAVFMRKTALCNVFNVCYQSFITREKPHSVDSNGGGLLMRYIFHLMGYIFLTISYITHLMK